ncbi:hypothetical protein GX586_07875, partial [bacterium]|nr:hypothetical protein [bacterium]
DAGARTNKLAYPFPRRTVYTYLADLGRSNTVVEFVAALRAQSRTTWNTNFTAGAINEYLRRGFQCIRIATTGLSTGVIGQAYSCVLQSDGGTYSNWWSLAGGELPEGLSLSADGCIDGTPADLFSADVSIRVDDSAGGRDVMSFPLVVVPEPASLLALAACLALARRRQRA